MNETLVSDIRLAPAAGEVRLLADAELDAVEGGWLVLVGFAVGFAVGYAAGHNDAGRSLD